MSEKSEQIAVLLPNHLGDVAMATPALRALRAGHPGAEITGVVRHELAPVLRGAPWLDRLESHGAYARRGPGRLRERLGVARRLRGVDAVLVLPNSLSAAFLALATGARRRVGYRRRGRGLLFSVPVDAPRGRDGRFQPVAMERYYLDLALALGGRDEGTALELFCEPESDRECDHRFEAAGLDPERPLVSLAPGAAFGPSKLWPGASYGELAHGLCEAGLQVALIHAPGEEALAEPILAREPRAAALGGAGMDLSLLKSVVARSALVVCNDAGARHIAAAFGVASLVLFGPTSLDYTNLNLERTRILREPVECAPCQKRVCPIDHRCMTRLRPERVLEEALRALRDPEWRGDVELELRA